MPNKAQFIELVAQRVGAERKQAQEFVDGFIDEVQALVAKGERVALTGFGIFEKRSRAARMARNPATGAAVRVKKTAVPAFRAGAEFKAVTSGAKKIAKVPAKKAAAPAKKAAAPAKKAAAKTTAAKAPAKKVAAKAPAKKAAAKAPAKKVAAKKTAARKSAR